MTTLWVNVRGESWDERCIGGIPSVGAVGKSVSSLNVQKWFAYQMGLQPDLNGNPMVGWEWGQGEGEVGEWGK